jgi:Mn2+/Fe2+ NRAMP family transporter
VLRQSLLLLGKGPRSTAQPGLVLPASGQAHPSLPSGQADVTPGDSGRAAWLYPFFLVIVAGGGLLLIRSFAADLRSLVDLATLLSFLTAPFFALANYALVTGRHTPPAARPGLALRACSWLGMLYLTGFSVYYLLQR